MYLLSGQWHFTIRQLAKIWCQPQRRVIELLDGESDLVRAVVPVKGHRVRTTLVSQDLAVRTYAAKLLPTLPADTNPLSPDELRALLDVLWFLKSDILFSSSSDDDRALVSVHLFVHEGNYPKHVKQYRVLDALRALGFREDGNKTTLF